ncbi:MULTISPECIES: hypothetical protein [Stenotrophomonas]|uniref:hypothetical protein n=1 Tax=Stenotrophomonas TaxID=40323 RepID=UPI0007704624|nr:MULTISPECIES: hypothetical protein [Stenotrophomonas]AMJ57309.1 hypothetical protein AXG53_12170 [Stenotrophomonas sp. KCTC 12332]
MPQPQRQHAYSTAASGVVSLRPLVLCLLMLLSLLASLCQSGSQLARLGVAENSTASAPAEERQGGERQLEEQSPAKLRKASQLRAAIAIPPLPSVKPLLLAATGPSPLRVAIPVSEPVMGHALASPRQQRGQAPPLS